MKKKYFVNNNMIGKVVIIIVIQYKVLPMMDPEHNY